MDFTTSDGNIWPMYAIKGGTGFGFCPGKATWDSTAVNLFKTLMATAQTGAMWTSGGLYEQPDWFIDMISTYLPKYDDLKFNARAVAILGDGESKPSKTKK
jgi:hypothetical protein